MGQVVSSLGSGSGCQAHAPMGLVPAIEHCLRTEPFCFIGGPCQEWDGVRWPCSEKVQAFWPDGYSWDLSSLPTNSHQWLETPQWFFPLWAHIFTAHSFCHPFIHLSISIATHPISTPTWASSSHLLTQIISLKHILQSTCISSYPIHLFLHLSIHLSCPFSHPFHPPTYPSIYAFNPLCAHPFTGLFHPPISL